jgi:DnaJ like chaperone protein
MSYWGKFIGGMAGFAMGGPVGALFGAALGHAADEGKLHAFSGMAGRAIPFDTARVAALLGRRDQIFAIGVTVLSAKLAKCDGPVTRTEIDAFKRSFAIPEASVAEVGRLFDNARESAAGFESYAVQLGQAFSDNRGILEQVLAGLYQIARVDGPVNGAEAEFLSRVASAFGLDDAAARRAGGGQVRQAPVEDHYVILGVARSATVEEIRVRWKQLVREHHPDALAARGASPARIKAASEKVARINAAYDALKRERRI